MIVPLSLKGLPLLRTLLHTLSALTRHGMGCPFTGGESIDTVTQPGLGLGEEVPGGQAPVLFCALPTHPCCLPAAGPGATAGRGSVVGYQLGYFHNGCLRLGGGGQGGGGGRGAATAASSPN